MTSFWNNIFFIYWNMKEIFILIWILSFERLINDWSKVSKRNKQSNWRVIQSYWRQLVNNQMIDIRLRWIFGSICGYNRNFSPGFLSDVPETCTIFSYVLLQNWPLKTIFTVLIKKLDIIISWKVKHFYIDISWDVEILFINLNNSKYY